MWRIGLLQFIALIFVSEPTFSFENHHLINILVAQVEKDSALIGLEIDVEDGWYFYYKEPGDVGIGTSIILDKENKISWPKYNTKEQIIGKITIKNNIYDKPTIFPIEIFNHNNKATIQINYAICGISACIPLQQTINVDLSEKFFNDTTTKLINSFRNKNYG